MKNYLYTTIILLFCATTYGQDTIIQVDQGAGYSQTVFLNLADNEMTTIDYTTWDIAFSTAGRSVAILVNEAATSGPTSKPVELFVTSSTDFEEVADTTLITDTLYNGDVSLTDGAFNSASDTSNVFDFGWGEYNPATHFVNGTRIFILQLRDGTYKKIRIDQYAGSQYTFTYADLDGKNLVTDSVNVADYEGKTLAYYSLRDQKVVDLEPENWDLKFTRYNTPVPYPDSPDEYLDYYVLGVLVRPDVEVAIASDIDPDSVKFEDYADSLTSDMNAIGHEWKVLDFSTKTYTIDENQVFFVKTLKNEVYKIQFLDFEGSSTGVTTLKSTLAEVLSALAAPQEYINETILFPNPVIGGQAKIKFQSEELRQNALLQISNTLGQEVYTQKINILRGENIYTLPRLSVPGLYYVLLRTEDGITTLPLINK